MADPHSLFNFYKKVIHLRKETPALHEGSLEIAHDLCNKKILAYYRVFGWRKIYGSAEYVRIRAKIPVNHVKILLSTHPQSEAHQLQPFEGRVIRLDYS